MNGLLEFMRARSMSVQEAAGILGVDQSTIRKYAAPKGSSMRRKLNPVAARLIAYIDAKHIPTDGPVARESAALSNDQFAGFLIGVSDSAAGEAFGVDRTTIYRWRTDLPVPATAAKLARLISLFGW